MHVRSLFAVALAALLASPAASAQAKPAPASASAHPAGTGAGVSIGGFVGYETDDLDGFNLRFDGEIPIQRLSPQLMLSGVGSVGLSFLSTSVGGYPGFQYWSGDWNATILKIVPAVRFTIPLSPQFSLFGDAGLGLYHAWLSTDYAVASPIYPYYATATAKGSDTGFMFRFGAGGFFQLSPRMKLSLMVQLDPMLGDYNDTTFSFLAGLMFGL